MKKILWVSDPLSKLKLDFDSTLFLMNRFQSFGYENYSTEKLIMVDSNVIAKCSKVKVNFSSWDPKAKAEVSTEEAEYKEILHFVCVFNRLEPPVDEKYLLQCKLMMFHPRVFNSPLTLQAYSEKLLPLYFNVGISSSIGLTQAPRKGVKKPLNLFGGTNVEKVETGAILDEGELFQDFLQEIHQGERRYLSIGTHVFGEVLKLPKEGEFRVNTFHGSTLSLTEQDQNRQLHALDLAKHLKQDLSITFGAIDYIGKKIVEINITCPTAYLFFYKNTIQSERERMDEALKGLLETSH